MRINLSLDSSCLHVEFNTAAILLGFKHRDEDSLVKLV